MLRSNQHAFDAVSMCYLPAQDSGDRNLDNASIGLGPTSTVTTSTVVQCHGNAYYSKIR